jgi:archaellum component FlaG (FlaF/FlaG flagellin family)
MADGGASELIMLITGLLTAGIVASLLISSWGGLANSVDFAQTEIEADAKTKATLTNDPMLVNWNQTSCNLTLFVQNIGEIKLNIDSIAVIVNGSASTVNQSQILGNQSLWISGEVAELNVCPSGVSMVSGQEIFVTIIVQSEFFKGIAGQYSFTEVIRLV